MLNKYSLIISTLTVATVVLGVIPIVPHSALAKHSDNNNNNNYSYSSTQSSSYNNNNGEVSSTNYYTGHDAGWYQAQTDWNSGQYGVYSYGNNVCPDGHSKSYCNGFHDGYTALWKQWIYNQEHGLNFVNSPQQTQGSDVNTNIKGNGNTVTNIINQGQASNSPNTASSGYGGNR
jgi:hypothetical protein